MGARSYVIIDSQMLVYVCFLGPKTKIRVIWIKFYKKIRIKRKNILGSDGRNFSLTYFYDFYTGLKELEMLFHPRRYNLMSENILNWERNFFVNFYTFSY